MCKMKRIFNIAFLLLFAAILIPQACKEKENPIKPDNEFSLECADSTWKDGSLSFPADKTSAKVTVVHRENANAWAIRCDLDAAWASFRTVDDDLYINVKANNGKNERSTWVDVVIGENSKRITIEQDFFFIPAYEPDPSVLPETTWNDDETIWR